VVTVAIAAWEDQIDRERAHGVLDGRALPPTHRDTGDTGANIAARRVAA